MFMVEDLRDSRFFHDSKKELVRTEDRFNGWEN